MIRNLKALGLALVAVFAMSSLVASAASAATLPDTDAIVTQTANYTLTGEQEGTPNKFTLAGQAVECTTAKVTAHVANTTVTEVTTTAPTYENCTYAGQAATVKMNECGYLLTGTTKTDEDAKADVDCPVGKKIELTLNAIACNVFISNTNNQPVEEGYTITTVGSGSTAELTLHITAKAKVTSVGDPGEGVTCASLTNGTGTLEGTFIVKAENSSGAQIGVTDETLTGVANE
jgi:hypothetical protein